MKAILKYKKILIAAIVIIVMFFLYSIFLKPDAGQDILVSSSAVSSTDFEAGRTIISLLVDLKSIQLSSELFQSKAFQSLEDFSLPIDPEPQGRPNPFAPIGSDATVEEGG